jgi:hypothetical protein
MVDDVGTGTTTRRKEVVALSLALWAAAALGTGGAQAQVVNVAKQLRDIEKGGLFGDIEASLDWRTGNTRLLSVHGEMALFYSRWPHLVFVSAAAAYAREGAEDETYIHRFFEHLRYRIGVIEWLGLEAFGQHDYNRFRRLEVRALGGAGLRFSFDLFDDTFFVAWGASYMYEYAEAGRGDHPDSGTVEHNHRFNNYLSLVLAPLERVTVDSTLYVQPRFDDFSDLLLLSESGLHVDVLSWLNIRISYTFFLDTRPFHGVHDHDSTLKTTVGVSLGPWLTPEPEEEEDPDEPET